MWIVDDYVGAPIVKEVEDDRVVVNQYAPKRMATYIARKGKHLKSYYVHFGATEAEARANYNFQFEVKIHDLEEQIAAVRAKMV